MKETPDPCEALERLIEHFDQNLYALKSPQYNEAQVRQEFINPFFTLLGWDMDNRQGYAEAYKDVIHEDAIKVGGYTKAPDYCFRVGGTRKFFVEAKKPSVNIKEDPDAAYQLRRYAWSAKLPLSILTDFEELAVYDCRIKPSPLDKSSAGRVQYIGYQDYVKEWGSLASVFSREAVLKGSFDKYVESNKAKRGTGEVDAAFLKEIEAWRDELARNLALRNPNLTTRELNFAVQATIDRVIFLRICEDRGVEDYARLMALQNATGVYTRLMELFRTADDRYNSGLFHFEAEKGRENPDTLTPKLIVDDKALKDILKGLYYPDSPYEFSVLPADILGQVYEQFLGKVIRLTAGHQAKVEDKPEVKKAGGVYYTPTYIVDYIVKNTVGKMLEGKTPKEISGETPKGAHPLRIADIACGSGSFLLGAYQYLLTWYRDRYFEDGPEKWAKGKEPRLYQASCGEWKLTTSERKRILLNHIYGVDIDAQAVEVTKLSLLLKVLEGETKESVSYQRRLFHERALPDLSRNIKCGNSLIGSDFYKGQQIALFDEEERIRINAFDWEDEFPEVFRKETTHHKGIKDTREDKGFDVVIGNPPYIRIQALKEWAPAEVDHYKQAYKSASSGNYDIYVIFVEKGLGLLNPKGRLGFILPNKFFNAEYGLPLREQLSSARNLAHVVHFGANQVFQDATTYTCLLFLHKGGVSQFSVVKVASLDDWRAGRTSSVGQVKTNALDGKAWNFVVGPDASLFERLRKFPLKLGDVATIFVGLQTSADDVFIMKLIAKRERQYCLESEALGTVETLEDGLFYPLVSGTDIKRYAVLSDRQYILFPYQIENETVSLVDFASLAKRWPKTAAYLLQNKNRLEDREKGKMKGPCWHGYIYLKNMTKQGIRKICVPRLVEHLFAAYDNEGKHFLDNVDVGGIIWKPEYSEYDLRYLLALLNSRLLRWYFPFVSAPFRGGWFSANKQFLSQLPVCVTKIDKQDKGCPYERVVSLVEAMLDLHKRLHLARTEQDKTLLQRQITATDKDIDRLVYDLYGLTEDEIAIVEAEK